MRRLALAAALLMASIVAALAQGTVTRIGPITPGDCASFSSPNSIQDGGFPCTGAAGGPAGGVLGTFPNPGFSTAVNTALTGTTGQLLIGTGGFGFAAIALGGDCTFTSPNITCTKLNGVSYGASPASDTTPVVTAANTATYTAIPNCPGGILQYTTATHLFNCASIVSGIQTSSSQGRVTLATGIAIMTSSVTAATTVYYTPSAGNIALLYNGSSLIPTLFSEVSQLTTDTTKSPAACVANTNYDIFVWSDAGTFRATRGPVWSTNTARGTGAGTSELVLVQGTLLNANAITNGPAAQRGTYVGTIRTNGTSTVDYIVGGSASGGTAASLGVWNLYNPNLATAQSVDTGAGYTYTTGTVRQARASAGNQAAAVFGLNVNTINVTNQTRIDTTATALAFGYICIGEDNIAGCTSPRVFVRSVAANIMIGSPYVTIIKVPSLGYHIYSANETGDGTNANNFDTDSNGTITLQVWN